MATNNLGLEQILSTDTVNLSMLNKMNNNMIKIDEAYGVLVAHLLEKTGKTNLNEAINYIDSLVNASDATATASKIFSGYTAYKGTQKITGTALATASTGAASQLLTGKKLYNSSGTLITGTMPDKSRLQQNANGLVSGNNYVLKVPVAGYYDTGSWLVRTKDNVINDLSIKEIPTINVSLTGDYTSYISGYGAGINKNGVLVIWAMSNSTSYENVYFYPTSIGIGSQGDGWSIGSDWDTSNPVNSPRACTVTGLSSYNTINITLETYSINTTYDYVRLNVTVTGS